MPKSKHETFRKRPNSATPERVAELLSQGLSQAAIARMWKVSRAVICQLAKKANEKVKL